MPVLSRRRGLTWLLSLAGIVALSLSSAACDSIYYKTMKRFGVEKRDILVKRVKDAQKSQREAKEEFQTALERFKTVVEVEHSSLEDKYNALSKELERREDKAKQVRDRIKAVRDVSNDLFDEWQSELGRYTDRSLRTESERELRATKKRAEELIGAMQRAEARIGPVLKPLQDRVLFLKHNLNARAIGALDRELVTVRGSVDSLVAELEASIQEADRFINDMGTEAAAGSS